MTLIPPAVYSAEHGIVSEKEEDANYVHNWLYSVVPAFTEREATSWRSDGITESHMKFPLAVYLTGFCRECRKAFSAPIPHAYNYIETQMEVPYYGCVKPGTNR